VSAVHVADVPGRGAPGTGEINFHSIRRVLDEHGFDRQITFEVVPTGDPDEAIAACKAVFPF
jgi:hydroxypyruvate isomerase